MAFRKSVKSFSPLSLGCLGFSETVPSDSYRNSSAIFQSLDSRSVDDLSKSTLPLVSLSVLLDSGKVIDGEVSFAPTDRSDLELMSTSALNSYVKSYQDLNSDNSPDQSGSSTELSDS